VVGLRNKVAGGSDQYQIRMSLEVFQS
jgi:hypothetical protein